MPIAVQQELEGFKQRYPNADLEESFWAGATSVLWLLYHGVHITKVAEEVKSQSSMYALRDESLEEKEEKSSE